MPVPVMPPIAQLLGSGFGQQESDVFGRPGGSARPLVNAATQEIPGIDANIL
jgi:hypothetical protein